MPAGVIAASRTAAGQPAPAATMLMQSVGRLYRVVGNARNNGPEMLSGALNIPSLRMEVLRCAGPPVALPDPRLPAERRSQLIGELMNARRDKGRANRADNPEARELARRRVDEAKRALGERGRGLVDRRRAGLEPAYGLQHALCGLVRRACCEPRVIGPRRASLSMGRAAAIKARPA